MGHASAADALSAFMHALGAALRESSRAAAGPSEYVGADNGTFGGHQQNGHTFGRQTNAQSTATYNNIAVETVNFHVCAPEPFVHVLFRTIRHSARGILTFLGEFPFAITGLSGLSLESAIKYLLYPMRRLFMYPFRLASNGESAATAGATSANQPRPVPGMCSSVDLPVGVCTCFRPRVCAIHGRKGTGSRDGVNLGVSRPRTF